MVEDPILHEVQVRILLEARVVEGICPREIPCDFAHLAPRLGKCRGQFVKIIYVPYAPGLAFCRGLLFEFVELPVNGKPDVVAEPSLPNQGNADQYACVVAETKGFASGAMPTAATAAAAATALK